MNSEIKKILVEFSLKKISKDELIDKLPFDNGNVLNELRKIVGEIISFKDTEGVNTILPVLLAFEENDEFLDILHKLILEPWHTRYEDIIHYIQAKKNPTSVSIIKEAIQNKYEFLESYDTGTGQFISQCGYALYSIGTKAAFDTIRNLAKSEDSTIKIEMEYQLKRLEDNPDAENTKKTKRWWIKKNWL